MVLAFSVFLEMHEIEKKRPQEASKRHVQGVEEEVALRSCHKMRFLSNGPCVFVVFKDAVTRSGASGPENVPKPQRLCTKVAVQDRSEELTTRRARPVGEGLGRGRMVLYPNIYPLSFILRVLMSCGLVSLKRLGL